MLSVTNKPLMISVIMQNVVMLSVVAPYNSCYSTIQVLIVCCSGDPYGRVELIFLVT